MLLEGLLYVAHYAYKLKTGEELPVSSAARPELGEGWDFDDDAEMQKRYPRLAKRYKFE